MQTTPTQRHSILIDASSAILLFKAGVLDHLLAAYRGVVALSVYRELTAGDAYPGAREIAALHQRGVLEVCTVPPAGEVMAKSDGVALATLGRGERDTLLYYLGGRGAFVVIDDGRGARCCRSGRIPFINALLVPRIFSLAGKMTEERCAAAFEVLVVTGRYSPGILAWARSAGRKELATFLP